jgi:hypothetical protein
LRKATPDMRIEIAAINNAPAILLFTATRLFFAATFAIAGEQIHALHTVLNPAKLAYVQRQLETLER